MLAVIAVALVVVVWPGVCQHEGHASVYMAHELTAWDMGLAVGFLVAARAAGPGVGMFPLACVLVACMVVPRSWTPCPGTRCSAPSSCTGSPAGLGCLWVVARRTVRTPTEVRRG